MIQLNCVGYGVAIATIFVSGCVAGVEQGRTGYNPDPERVVNLLTDVSHNYSFKLSWANRNQTEIYKGFNCLTSLRSIHAADLKPINALVLLLRDRLPYSPKDAPHVLNYVKEGGGIYLSLQNHGKYRGSLNKFLKPFGLETGDYLSDNPADWGICAHAPSEIVLPIDGKYERITASGGVWGEGSRSSVGFEIHGDGKVLYKSDVIKAGMRAKIDVDIKGVKILKLVTNDGGNGKSADCSVWFDPRLVKGKTKSRVLLANATSVKVGWARAAQDRHYSGTPLGSYGRKISAIVATDHPAAVPGGAYSKSGWSILRPLTAGDWQTVYKAGDKPVVFARKYGKGVIIADTTSLYNAANGADANAMKLMRRMLDYMAAGKVVKPVKGGGGWQGSDGYHWERLKTTKDGLQIWYNDYTEMFVKNDIQAYKASVKYLHELTGLDEKMKARQIKEKRELEAKYFNGEAIRVDISGVKKLELISTDGGNGNGSDHSVWADAWFTDAQGNRTPLRLVDASAVNVGYGKATQDCHDKTPISIGGKVFKTGVFVHAPSLITYPAAGRYTTFTAHVGCNDTNSGSVGFKVIGDGKTLWESKVVYRGGKRRTKSSDPMDINYIPDDVLFRIRYLACQGAGFLIPQGSCVDLAEGLETDWRVHLGMFAHEMGHAWSFPFCECVGEEASAFIFNNLVLHRHNGQKHGDSVTRRLTNYLKKPELDAIDLAKKADNFKYYMFIDLMIREYGEDVWKNYNLLKYALLNKEGAQWNPHTTAWLWSIAVGEDVFPRFQTAFGSSMVKSKAKLPAKAMAVGFDPVAIGKMYNVPLKKLPRMRKIFDNLKTFKDVREFYKKETAEKGHPKVEG